MEYFGDNNMEYLKPSCVSCINCITLFDEIDLRRLCRAKIDYSTCSGFKEMDKPDLACNQYERIGL